MTETNPLHQKWVLWCHSHKTKGWSIKDYDKYAVIATVEEFWHIYNGIPSLLNGDMWFLMREGIEPRWEAPVNREGGSFQFRMHGSDLDNTWLILSMHLVSETMCRDPADANLIAGISISPKRDFYTTLNVWNLDSTRADKAVFPGNINGVDFDMTRYTPNSKRKLG